MNNGHYVVRTKMAEALIAAMNEAAPKRKSRMANKVIHRVLTNISMNVGVKFDSSRGKKIKADSAVDERKVAA